MRTSSSAHDVCLRGNRLSINDHSYWDRADPAINIRALTTQLEDIQKASKGKGKKRQAGSDFHSSDRPRKLWKDEEVSQGDARLVDVFTHTFHFHCSTIIPDDVNPQHFVQDKDMPKSWAKQEEELHAAIQEADHDPIDLGEVNFTRQSSHTYASFRGSDTDFPMPTLHQDEALEDMDIDPNMSDLFLASITLARYHRAELHGNCRLVPVHENNLSFHLEIDLHVSLISSEILLPYPSSSVKDLQARESAQRRVLDYAFPPPFGASESSDAANIAFFYSILQSAPTPSSQLITDAMQPEELLTPLLPFQRRTVAWLLDREGISVNEQGQLSRKDTTFEYSFWRELVIGDVTWYRHGLTGQLSASLPTTPQQLGAILAEEPGLGKTLETIALIMLNPTPESSLMVKNYDDVAKVTVTSVKVLLMSVYCFRIALNQRPCRPVSLSHRRR